MSLKLKFRESVSCPRHPRYNPELDGESGIKGGCLFCYRLLELLRIAFKLRGGLKNFRAEKESVTKS